MQSIQNGNYCQEKNVFKMKISPESISIGKRIASLREGLGLSQEEFAELVGVESKGTISNWEKGRRLPDLIQVAVIAQACGVSTDWILLGDDDAIESRLLKELLEKEKENQQLKREKYTLGAQIKKLNKVAEHFSSYNKINPKK